MAKYRFNIGHTAITWDSKTQIEQAMSDLSSLGYRAFECFGWILVQWANERPGEYEKLLEKYNILQYSTFGFFKMADPTKRDEEIATTLRRARYLKELGGRIAVISGAKRRQESYSPAEVKAMAAAATEVCKQLRDIGIQGAFHQHTGTEVETQDETYAFMNEVDTRYVKFAPDIGQLAKGGGDPVKVVRDFASIITHAHLKDFCGTEPKFDEKGKEIDPTGYLHYTTLGDGVVDIPAILDILTEAGFDGYLMVELDGTPRSPKPAREQAARSRAYLESIGVECVG